MQKNRFLVILLLISFQSRNSYGIFAMINRSNLPFVCMVIYRSQSYCRKNTLSISQLLTMQLVKCPHLRIDIGPVEIYDYRQIDTIQRQSMHVGGELFDNITRNLFALHVFS